jgi:hypothetical protein
MKPEKKTAETMKTTPATIPTQAATVVSRLCRCGSADAGGGAAGGGAAGGGAAGGGAAGGGAAVSTGPVAGSEDDVVSLMNPSMQAVPMCLA